MLRTSSSLRYHAAAHRSKGLKAKDAVQLVMLIVVVIWLSFHFKHSHGDDAVPASHHQVQDSDDFLIDTSIDPGRNSLGRKGAGFQSNAQDRKQQWSAEHHPDEHRPDQDLEEGGTGLLGQQQGELGSLERNDNQTVVEVDDGSGPGYKKNKGLPHALTSQDGGDGDDEGEDDGDKNEDVEDNDAIADHDNPAEDFFNDSMDNQEEMESLLSEMEKGQSQSNENIENDDIGTSFLHFQSDRSGQDSSLDFEGEDSVQDRRVGGENENLETDVKDPASPLHVSASRAIANEDTSLTESNGTMESGEMIKSSVIRTDLEAGNSREKLESDGRDGKGLNLSFYKSTKEKIITADAGKLDQGKNPLPSQESTVSITGAENRVSADQNSHWGTKAEPTISQGGKAVSDFERAIKPDAATVPAFADLLNANEERLNYTDEKLEEAVTSNETIPALAEHLQNATDDLANASVGNISKLAAADKYKVLQLPGQPDQERDDPLNVTKSTKGLEDLKSTGDVHLELAQEEEAAGNSFQRDAV